MVSGGMLIYILSRHGGLGLLEAYVHYGMWVEVVFWFVGAAVFVGGPLWLFFANLVVIGLDDFERLLKERDDAGEQNRHLMEELGVPME